MLDARRGFGKWSSGFQVNKPVFLALSFAAALAAGSGSFFDRAETMQRAASGLAARHGLVEAGLRDKLVALAYESGGWTAADALRGLGTAVPVFLSLLLAAALVSRLPWIWVRRGGRLLPVLILCVFAWGVWNGFSVWRHGIRDPRLLAPTELLGRASQIEGRVFFSPNALFLAPMFASGKIEPKSSLAEAARLCAFPAEWRAEDRKSPFSAAMLSGQSGPLLEMLQASPGWRLAATDNHGVLFVRGGKGIQEPTPETAQMLFPNPADRAVYLAQASLLLQTIQRSESASTLMKQALELDAENPHVLLCSASLASVQGRWSAAREAARKVLKLSPGSAQASYILALAMFESGAISKSSAEIASLAARQPNDPQILRLQARIASAENDPATEVSALEKLLLLAKNNSQPTENLQVLLGQAWAKRGFPDQALENYQAALEGDLPPAVKKQIEEAMATIRQRTR
jgi:thioredoxin-like negative regulator of GroEL